MRELAFCLAILACATALHAVTWEFDGPDAAGVPPTDWQDASQTLVPFPSPPGPYRKTTFDGRSVVEFQTEAMTTQRPKIRSRGTYREGLYRWRVYIPPKEANAQVSTGAFLYSDQSGGGANAAREVDFEIGPGRASVRASIPNLPEDALLVYLTIQPDNAPGRSGEPGSSLLFRPADPANHVFPDTWYTFLIHLGTDAGGHYTVDWYIQRDGGPLLKARPTHVAAYGPAGPFPTDFRIYCSLENLAFMGDALPTRNHVVFFDSVVYTPTTCEPGSAGAETLTSIDGDTLAPAQPGAWESRGTPAPALALEADPLLVDEGTRSLRLEADLTATTGAQVVYTLPDPPRDLACATALQWRARRLSGPTAALRLLLEEADGDIWLAADPLPVPANWSLLNQPLHFERWTLVDNAGGGDLDLQATAIGFQPEPLTPDAGPTTLLLDLVQLDLLTVDLPGAAGPADPPVLPVVSGLEPPDFTTTAFPPDPVAPGFPAPALPGEWTRFGTAYDGIALIEDPGTAAGGTHYLEVRANWTAGNRVGVRFVPYGPPADWTGYTELRAQLRSVGPAGETTAEFALFESDGDIWITAPGPIAPDWEDFTVALSEDLLSVGAGNQTLDLNRIHMLGWNFDNDSGAGTATILVDSIRLAPQSGLEMWQVY